MNKISAFVCILSVTSSNNKNASYGINKKEINCLGIYLDQCRAEHEHLKVSPLYTV